jgi:hypothetical protein
MRPAAITRSNAGGVSDRTVAAHSTLPAAIDIRTRLLALVFMRRRIERTRACE